MSQSFESVKKYLPYFFDVTTNYYYRNPENRDKILSGGCGGGQDNGGSWMTLSGIHINDSRYYGGYAGNSSTMSNTFSPYLCGGGTGWNINGWVLMSW